MADAVTNRFKYLLASGTLGTPTTADMRMGLLSTFAATTNVPDINTVTEMEAHADFAELTGASGYARVALTGETATEVDGSDWALIDCDDVAFGALGTGGTIVGYFIVKYVDGAGGDIVLQMGSLTSTPTNGGTVTVTTTSGITKLV